MKKYFKCYSLRSHFKVNQYIFLEIRNLNLKLDFGSYTLDLENFLRAPKCKTAKLFFILLSKLTQLWKCDFYEFSAFLDIKIETNAFLMPENVENS